MLFTNKQMQRMFARIVETPACPKHGGDKLAVCHRCDVVLCQACGGKCGCPDNSPSELKLLLGEVAGIVRGMTLREQWPFDKWLLKAGPVLRQPEEQLDK